MTKMDTYMFEAWSSLAKDARMAHMRRELTTEEFLRRIDVFHELDSYDVSAPMEPGKSILQERVERNIDFDPESAYQAVQVLDMRDPSVKPEWKTYSAEECKRWEQQGTRACGRSTGRNKKRRGRCAPASPYIIVYRPERFVSIHEKWPTGSAHSEYPARRCKNCGRWFVLTGHQGLEYCSRPFDEKGHTCRDVGAGLKWERKSKEDKPFMAYRKEYKKRFSRIKAGRITNEEFLVWGERAWAKKRECDEGTISLDEFREWLENS